jgi:ferredoxin-fold anticodon binding domain-containing protein
MSRKVGIHLCSLPITACSKLLSTIKAIVCSDVKSGAAFTTNLTNIDPRVSMISGEHQTQQIHILCLRVLMCKEDEKIRLRIESKNLRTLERQVAGFFMRP